MKRLGINLHTSSQSGDTIVEVLIAIAIVSVILVGAFLVSNRSTRAVRDSQEHAEAQQLLQGQVEQLRTYVQGGSVLPAGNAAFCFNTAGVIKTTLSQCAQSFYSPVITPSSVSTNLYDCVITWPSLQGGTAKEEFFYRVYAS